MAQDSDLTADALGRALGTLFGLGQAGIDWATVARAVLVFREEQRQRWLDQHDDLSAHPLHDLTDAPLLRRKANAGNDGAALLIELQSALTGGLLRMGRDWQRLLQAGTPALKRAIEDYRADAYSSPQTTEALINQLVVFTQSMGEFMRDQGAQAEHSLQVLQNDLLGRHGEESPLGGSMRRPRG